MNDNVNHPKHYTDHPSGIECIQITEHMNFWQRCDAHSQKEHRELALQMLELFCQEFPMIGELVKTHKPVVSQQDWLPPYDANDHSNAYP